MSNKITLRAIIETYQVDENALAEKLFPNTKYPKLAMARIMEYSTQLTLEQISIIADLAGLLPKDLAIALLD